MPYIEEVGDNNAVASSSRAISSTSSKSVADRATGLGARRRQPSISSASTPLLHRFGLPTFPRILPLCDDRSLPLGHPQRANPLCSTSNRAVVLALLVIGATYLIHRRYQRWLARRRERMSEARRRELERDTDTVELSAEIETANANRAENQKGTAPGRKKKKGNALLTQDGSTDRSASSSASPVRNRGKSAATTAIASPAKLGTLPERGHVNVEDNSDFTLVTKGRPNRSNSSASSAVAPSALFTLSVAAVDGEALPSPDLEMTSPSGKSAKKKKKKNNVQTNDVNDGGLLQRTTSNDLTLSISSDTSASDVGQGTPNGAANSPQVRPPISSSELTVRALSASPTLLAPDIEAAVARRGLDEERVRHRQEIANLQREVARYQALSEEAQRAEEVLRLEAVVTRRDSDAVKGQLKSLEVALHQAKDEVTCEVRRRESLASELAADSSFNGFALHGESEEAIISEIAQLRQENVRLQDDLRRQQASSASTSSPSSRSRDSLHHAELNRFRDESNKSRLAERFWRSRAEQSDRLVSEFASGQTDLQRKLAEQSTACQQLAAQYAQARHIIHQYEVAIQFERSRHLGPSPVSPLAGTLPNGNGGMPNAPLNAFLAPAASQSSMPALNGTPMIMLPNAAYAPSPQAGQHLHQASPNVSTGWFETTRNFPSQLSDQVAAQPGTPTHTGSILQTSHITTHASAPDMSTSIAWSVLKNRDLISGGKATTAIPANGTKNGAEGIDGFESPRTGAASTTSESRSASGSSPRSTASKLVNETPAEMTGGSDMDTLVNGSPVMNGLSPRRKFSGQLIDIAAAAMERRLSATSTSSRGSHSDGNPNGTHLLPSPLEITEHIASRSRVGGDDHPPDSPTDSGIPLIFASVHHDPSEMEAYRLAMEEQETSRRRDKEAEKNRETSDTSSPCA